MTSSRPPDAADSSAPKRSPVPGAITLGVDHAAALVARSAVAEVKNTFARPSTSISEYTTAMRLRVASNAGAGYERGPRNAPTEMLKQYGGERTTSVVFLVNRGGWLTV